MAASPYLNHFTQPDSIVPDPYNPQSWNRYSYVGNNPILYNDPTGHYRVENEGGGGCTDLICDDALSGGGSDDDNSGNTGGSLSKNSRGSSGGGGCDLSTLTNANGDYCHNNAYTPKPICFEWFECDPYEQRNYASRFQYIGQNPFYPIDPYATDSTDGYVMGGDFMSDNYLAQRWIRELGAVWVETHGATMINFTYESHIFYEGQIRRTVSDNKVTTVGYGTNANWYIAAANQYLGPVAFEINDIFMLTFSTMDQLSNGRVVQLMDAIATP